MILKFRNGDSWELYDHINHEKHEEVFGNDIETVLSNAIFGHEDSELIDAVTDDVTGKKMRCTFEQRGKKYVLATNQKAYLLTDTGSTTEVIMR